jgi:serine/threonine protein kinase
MNEPHHPSQEIDVQLVREIGEKVYAYLEEIHKGKFDQESFPELEVLLLWISERHLTVTQTSALLDAMMMKKRGSIRVLFPHLFTVPLVTISKFHLDFDKPAGTKLPVFHQLYDHITLTCSDGKVEFAFENIESPHMAYTLHFIPEHVVVRKDPVVVQVRLFLKSTTKQRRVLPVQFHSSKLDFSSQLFMRLDFESEMVEELDYNELLFQDVIGEGSYGRVWRARWRGDLVALKEFKFEPDFEKERFISRLLPEHPNVVKYIGACTSPPQPASPCIVTEFIPGKSLDHYYGENNPLPLEICIEVAIEICRGMSYLHQSSFLHLDLKPQNLLVVSLDMTTPAPHIKIADFGVSRLLGQRLSRATVQGSPIYQAPEVFSDFALTRPADVYSFAVTLWEMTTGLKPFDEHAQLDYFKFLDMRASGERPGPIPANNPLKDILNQCLDANPEIRPTFSVLINQLEALKQKPAPSWRASSIQRHSIQKVYLRHLQDFEEAKKKALATPSNTNVKPEKVANKFQVGNDVKQIFERMWVNDDESDYAIFEYDDTNSLKVATSAKDGMEGLKKYLQERENQRLYIYYRARFTDEYSSQYKLVFITWVTEKVPAFKRAFVSTDKAIVKQVVKDFTLELFVSSLDELDEGKIVQKVKDMSNNNTNISM